MKLSVVSTLFRSAPYLVEFYERVSAAARGLTGDYEIVLVNDGSPDDALSIAVSLHEKDPKVVVIDLSRNFGHHKAMMTGLAHARGDVVFLVDCDLEIAPEALASFHEKYTSSGADVVYGVQHSRQEPLLDRIAARLFYAIHNALSTTKLPHNLTTARLMSRRYVAALVSHQEREVLIAGLWAITGFQQVPIAVCKRSKGLSAYSVRHKLSVLVDSVTSFSAKPLVLMFYLGCAVSFAAILAAIALVVRWAFWGRFLAGWPSLIVSIWLLGGIIILCLGTLGIYLGKVLSETKRRPYTIIRQIYKRGE